MSTTSIPHMRIVRFSHVSGSLEATRMRVDAEIALAIRRTGTARLLEFTGVADDRMCSLWQTFVCNGEFRRPITHVAVVDPRIVREGISSVPCVPADLTLKYFCDVPSAFTWLLEAL